MSNYNKGDYSEGDLIEAVKGETVIRGRLDFKLELELSLALRSDVLHLKANGYTVRTIEKAAPLVVLPTEYGYYLDYEGHIWELSNLWFKRLFDDEDSAEDYAPFTPLAPVSETAKKVLDRVNGWWSHDEHRGLPIFLSALRVQFGVSE